MIDTVIVKYNRPKEFNPLEIKGRHDLTWGTVKEYIEARLDGMCEICGEIPRKLHVHHKNERSLDNRIENLKGVCPSCHRKIHNDEV